MTKRAIEYIVTGSVRLCTSVRGKYLEKGQVFSNATDGVTDADIEEWKKTNLVRVYMSNDAAGPALSKEEQDQIDAILERNRELEKKFADMEADGSKDTESDKDDSKTPAVEVPNGLLDLDPDHIADMSLEDLNLLIATKLSEVDISGDDVPSYKRKDFAIKYLSRDFKGK